MYSLYRQGDFKLLVGFPGLYSGWYLPNHTVDALAGSKVLHAVHQTSRPAAGGRGEGQLTAFTLENLGGWDDEPHLYNLKGTPLPPRLNRFVAHRSLYRASLPPLPPRLNRFIVYSSLYQPNAVTTKTKPVHGL